MYFFLFCLSTQNHIETKTIHIHFQMSYEVWRAIHMNNKKLKLYGFRVKRQTNTVWVVLRGFSKLSIQYVSSLSISSGHKLQKTGSVFSINSMQHMFHFLKKKSQKSLVMWSCISSIIFFHQHYINCCSFYPMKENLDTL